MMLKKKLLMILSLLVILSLVPDALAQQGHMKLLAVSEYGEGYTGRIADLYLEVRPGTGKVYLQTFPLLKVDTQISTRFAKEIACKFIDKDCSKYDFFYTIEAASTIVGGPSAGSSIAVLTIAVLEGLEINPKVALTGSINSGGIIGPISGVKEKIEAAKAAGIDKVLIPMEQIEIITDNETINLAEFGEELNISVIEVSDLNDVIFEFSGKQRPEDDKEIEINDNYINVMQKLSETLCSRSDELYSELNSLEGSELALISEEFIMALERAENLSIQGGEAADDLNFYSAASFCFGSNVQFHKLINHLKNMSNDEVNAEVERLSRQIEEFNKFLDSFEISTITDLQAQMIVNERLLETKERLADAENNSAELAYAYERFFSAVSWSKFLNQPGAEFELQPEELKKSCMEKINEVEERMLYAQMFFPSLVEVMEADLVTAQEYYSSGDYALCLFKASQTKADANILLSSIGVKEDAFESFIERKLAAAKREIVKQIDKGTFPIVAYSYYEYAQSLKATNHYSALVYAEYAIELSNIDIYFKKKEKEPLVKFELVNNPKVWFFIIGLILGFLLAFVVCRGKTSKPKKTYYKPMKNKQEEVKVKRYKRKYGKGIRLKKKR